MNRRDVLGNITLIGSVAIAGCSSDGGREQDTSPDNEQSESDDGQSAEPTEEELSEEDNQQGSASFEIEEWDVPSEIEINETFTQSVMVTNTGDAAGELSTELYQRTPESDWTSIEDADFGTIEPGETATVSYDGISYRYVNRYEFRLGDFEQTTVLQTVSAKLEWGAEFTTPNGYVIRVDEPNFQATYSYEDYSGASSEARPEDGGQWVFVNAYVKNETGQAAFSPLGSEFALIYGSSQADGETLLINDPAEKGEPFDGGELQPNVERSGWIAYEVPSGLSVEDVRIAWSQTTLNGPVSVNWES